MKIKMGRQEVLHQGWSTLTQHTYECTLDDGTVQTQSREAYDRGNGTVALLYNPEERTVILTRQFRLPTYLNGNVSGMMVEACAGKLEEEDPRDGILREILEETGHQVTHLEKVFEAYMSPGTVTEVLHFYTARYDKGTRLGPGGGLPQEQENIQVLELPFSEALAWIQTGQIKDAKTIMLLQHALIDGLL